MSHEDVNSIATAVLILFALFIGTRLERRLAEARARQLHGHRPSWRQRRVMRANRADLRAALRRKAWTEAQS